MTIDKTGATLYHARLNLPAERESCPHSGFVSLPDRFLLQKQALYGQADPLSAPP
jgi:hypothetical protein